MINASTHEHALALQEAITKLGRAGFHASACGIWIAVTDRTCLGLTTMLSPDQVDSFIAIHNPS